MDIVGECNFLLGKKRFSFLGGRVPELKHAGFVVSTTRNVLCLPISWSPPSVGYKANVDGSSSSAGAGGGGQVRDVRGHVIIAFSSFFGRITNNEAEIRVIWDMLVLCEEHGIELAEIQSDSLQVVHAIQDSQQPLSAGRGHGDEGLRIREGALAAGFSKVGVLYSRLEGNGIGCGDVRR